MKKFILVLFTVLLYGTIANAETCEQRIYQQCMRQEANKSDASRSGATREEFCAVVAVMECKYGKS